uniref:Probable mannose-6-phosphate isomerase n=1 Tax=Dermatophagoides pteronyssinus TaxID=6956 RepID=A0A6P6YN83_DERPT|nr:probable mannose-6-phosphate isomerase [Dermatophagoides pteronyssinus]
MSDCSPANRERELGLDRRETENDQNRIAEIWYGTHNNGTSTILDNNLGSILLSSKLKEYNIEIKFMLKILMIEKPLSIQVHPVKTQAMALNSIDPKNFPDPNSKAEICIAISDKFYLMCGLRDDKSLNLFEHTPLYEYDIGVLTPFFLNCIKLEKYGSAFIPPGTPHSYVSGDCIEILENSDNVIRGGLTPKHKDINLFIKNIQFTEIIVNKKSNSQNNLFCHSLVNNHCHDYFKIYQINAVCGLPVALDKSLFKENRLFFLLCCDGSANVKLDNDFSLNLKHGDCFCLIDYKPMEIMSTSGKCSIILAF